LTSAYSCEAVVEGERTENIYLLNALLKVWRQLLWSRGGNILLRIFRRTSSHT
jgi:hypothetical protein